MRNMVLRIAKFKDLPALVNLLSDDPLGKLRENPSLPLDPAYETAFRAIAADPNNELIVLANEEDEVMGMLQLTWLPSLTYIGKWRAQIEGVRIDSRIRGRGFGKRMFEWAIQRAKEKGCCLVQLTTDKKRPMAHKFYEALGFKSTHEGMKLNLLD
jgi:GNAT superfamily N-acetyltransferase